MAERRKPALPQGFTAAVKSLRDLRVPDDATDEQRAAAEAATEAMIAVMRGEVHPSIAFARLQAAKAIRDEICGPVPQSVRVSVKSEAAERMLAGRRRLAAELSSSEEDAAAVVGALTTGEDDGQSDDDEASET